MVPVERIELPTFGLQNLSGVPFTYFNVSAGSGSAHNNVQPTIVCYYIIRII
jgi:hypothetical protein